MKKLCLMAVCLGLFAPLCSCSNNSVNVNGSIPKNELAYEQKYLVIFEGTHYYYGGSDFGVYYIFYEDGHFERRTGDGNITYHYKYAFDSKGDLYCEM